MKFSTHATQPFTVNKPTVIRVALFVQPVRQWLNSIEIRNPQVARSLCHLIPARCPFERTIKVFNCTIVRVPPLCK
ncbi:hypothetical protein IQ268_09465 [Oculatella sp. LEGE 06141]|nr:hypothetical protein [Oculatella sp. LEGE 06141]